MSSQTSGGPLRDRPGVPETMERWDDLPAIPRGVSEVMLNDDERLRIGVTPAGLVVVVAYRAAKVGSEPKTIRRHIAQSATFGEAMRHALTLSGSELDPETIEWYVRALPWSERLP